MKRQKKDGMIEHKFKNLIEILFKLQRQLGIRDDKKEREIKLSIWAAIRILRSITPEIEYILMAKKPTTKKYKEMAIKICKRIWPPERKPIDERGKEIINKKGKFKDWIGPKFGD